MALKFRHQLLSAAALSGLALGAGAGLAASPSPFNSLEGVWGGSGSVRFSNGKSERLVCKAYYNSKDSGVRLSLAIRCASASYKIELRSQLSYGGGRVKGTWEERTYNTAGSVVGTAASGSVRLTFSGNVAGAMSVSFGGSQQRVTISAGTGPDTKPASIYLNLSRNN